MGKARLPSVNTTLKVGVLEADGAQVGVAAKDIPVTRTGWRAAGVRLRLLAAGVIVCAAVGGCFFALFLAVGDLRATSAHARHSDQVLANAHELEKLVLDLETGQRGYRLTHDRRFLQPWQAARTEAPREAVLLRRLVADNPVQEQRAAVLQRAIASYIRFTIEVMRGAPPPRVVLLRSLAGKRQVDALRRRFATFDRTEQALSDRRQRRSNAASRRTTYFTAAALALSLAFLGAFFVYLGRIIVRPVRKIAAAARSVATGNLGVRVSERAPGDIGVLARAFNQMTIALEHSRDELESQNAELELQTAELEDQQAQLAEAHDEMLAQQSELERALADLQAERRRVGAFSEFGERIAGIVDQGQLDSIVVDTFAAFFEAPIVVLYSQPTEPGSYELAAARGAARDALQTCVVPGEGIAGVALDRRQSQTASGPLATMVLPTVSGSTPARHELYVPLLHGDAPHGVIVLAWVSDTVISADDIAAAEHLAGQAGAAYAHLHSFRAEQQQAQLNAAILDATRDGIALIDGEGRFVRANAAFYEIRAIHGIPNGLAFDAGAARVRAQVEDPESFTEWFRRISEDPTREDGLEYRLQNGRSFALFTAPVLSGGGLDGARLLVVRETTAEREADRLKTELVATVSHELRTPLASILGFAELLTTREIAPEHQLQYMQTIYSESERLAALVDDFLDLQRIEQGSFDLDRAPFDVAELVREKIELFRGQSDEHQFELRTAAGVTAYADRARVTQVVANLLSNAIKYSPAGGPVEVGVERQNGAVRVSVSDQGLGIPAAERERIFERFYRVTSDGREIGGTGLGLALCKEIVAAHEGDIGFDSVEGRGTTFWFTLPAANEAT